MWISDTFGSCIYDCCKRQHVIQVVSGGSLPAPLLVPARVSQGGRQAEWGEKGQVGEEWGGVRARNGWWTTAWKEIVSAAATLLIPYFLLRPQSIFLGLLKLAPAKSLEQV